MLCYAMLCCFSLFFFLRFLSILKTEDQLSAMKPSGEKMTMNKEKIKKTKKKKDRDGVRCRSKCNEQDGKRGSINRHKKNAGRSIYRRWS